MIRALRFLFSTSLAFLLSSCQIAQKSDYSFRADPKNGRILDGASKADTILIPQWHLSPQVNTRLTSSLLPQAENQLSIERQLTEWLAGGELKSVIVEGCEGEIRAGFNEKFNGWTLEDLQKLEPLKREKVVSHIGLKLESRFGDKVPVLCGDDPDLIRKHQLALSDLRGLMGFKMRLEQLQNDPFRRVGYLKSLRPLLSLDPSASDDDVTVALRQRLHAQLAEYERILAERNKVFLRTLAKAPQPSAIVIGALHVPDLRTRLGKQSRAVIVFEPRGLKNDDGLLIEQLKKLIGD